MTEPFRVAQVMGKMSGGGVESVVMNYYRAIDRNAVQFDFIIDSDSTIVPKQEILRLGGRVFMVPPCRYLVSYRKELRELIEKERWSILHSHINALSVFPLQIAKAMKVPVRIAHSHSTAGKGEPVRNIAKYCLRIFSNKYPTYKMACSGFAGEWLFGSHAEFEILYNAIELNKFAYNAPKRIEVREELGLSSDQFVLGHVGRFMTQKNHGCIVDVFASLVKVRDNSVLVFVGDGKLRSSIEDMVAERGLKDKVIFLGQRWDVERLYQAFDVFLLPSLYEGLGLTAIEAQMAGLPCYLSDRVPREADVTKSSRFLPIDNLGIWSSALASAPLKTRNVVNYSDFSSYDLASSADRLLRTYLKLGVEATL